MYPMSFDLSCKKGFSPLYKKYLQAVITHMLKIILTNIHEQISKRDSSV